MSKFIQEHLERPFPEQDLQWRVQQAGEKNGRIWARVLTYIDNRAIMDRLDEVCGIGGWQLRSEQLPSIDGNKKGSFKVEIGIKIDGEWVWKGDVSDATDIESVKGAYSGAMKRAGAQWGIGRYLYNLEAGYADVTENGKNFSKLPNGGKGFKWNPPALPKWALPKPILKIDSDEFVKAQGFIKDKGVNVVPQIESKYFVDSIVREALINS